MKEKSAYLALYHKPNLQIKQNLVLFYNNLCPWNIRVGEGQRINVTWYVTPLIHSFNFNDFSSDKENYDNDEEEMSDVKFKDGKENMINVDNNADMYNERNLYLNNDHNNVPNFDKITSRWNDDNLSNCIFKLEFIENELVEHLDSICINQAPKRKLAYFSKTNKLSILVKPIQLENNVTPTMQSSPSSSSSSPKNTSNMSTNLGLTFFKQSSKIYSIPSANGSNYISNEQADKDMNYVGKRSLSNVQKKLFLKNLHTFLNRPFVLHYRGF